MKKTIYICDGCGREVAEEDLWTIVAHRKTQKKRGRETIEMMEDACEDYVNGFKDMLHGPDQKRTGGKDPKYDRGKIISLHKAGWSVSKIADEMNCSPTTVKTAIEKAAL